MDIFQFLDDNQIYIYMGDYSYNTRIPGTESYKKMTMSLLQVDKSTNSDWYGYYFIKYAYNE